MGNMARRCPWVFPTGGGTPWPFAASERLATEEKDTGVVPVGLYAERR